MAFEGLQERLQGIFKKISGQGTLTEANMEEMLKDRYIRDGYLLLHEHLDGIIDRDADSNLLYQIKNDAGAVLFSNTDTMPGQVCSLNYLQVKENGGNEDVFYVYGMTAEEVLEEENAAYKETTWFQIDMALKEGLPANDEYKFTVNAGTQLYAWRWALLAAALLSLALLILCYVSLLCVSGRRPGSEDLFPGYLHRVPYDVFFGVCALAAFGVLWVAFSLVESFFYTGNQLLPALIAGAGCGSVLFLLFLGVSMSTAVRIKDRSLLKNTLLWRILSLIGRFFRFLWTDVLSRLPLIWKTVLITGVLSLIEFLIIVNSWDVGNIFAGWLIEKLILVPLIFWFALGLRRLQNGGRKLAQGDLSYQISEKGLAPDLKEHARNLNHISDGMSLAVDERMKSERMKTELITNVSHDLKTPLTSIINYAGLIAEEPVDNPKVTEYSEVLVRQSERLKRLIEDLVEASKASSGAIDIELAPCDAAVFLTQAAGEYEEKLEKSDLALITKIPEDAVYILADSRRMWRIFDNLMGNICKYAQPQTRVYLTLEETPDAAVISFKNTSRDALDISEEELMERFVRGDASRSTEGNGLGLSIARSLAELQRGTLSVSIDGDLFKAVLTFPKIVA